MGTASERTGVLVVRAWLEGSPPNVIRARVTQTIDVSAPGQVVTVARSTDEIILAVQAWLDAFLREGSSGRAPAG